MINLVLKANQVGSTDTYLPQWTQVPQYIPCLCLHSPQ